MKDSEDKWQTKSLLTRHKWECALETRERGEKEEDGYDEMESSTCVFWSICQLLACPYSQTH